MEKLHDKVKELANIDIVSHGAGWKIFDIKFALSWMDANDEVWLNQLINSNIGQTVKFNDWRAGYIPKNVYEFNPDLDVERWIVERKLFKDKKDYGAADEIRRFARSHRYEIRDGVNGTLWFLKYTD